MLKVSLFPRTNEVGPFVQTPVSLDADKPFFLALFRRVTEHGIANTHVESRYALSLNVNAM